MNPTSLLSGLGAAVGANPSLGGANAGAAGSAPTGTGDLFLALVAGLLGDGAGAAPQQDGSTADGTASTSDASSTDATDPALPSTSEPTDPSVATPAPLQLPTALAGLVPGLVPAAPVAARTVGGAPTGEAASDTTVTAPGDATGDATVARTGATGTQATTQPTTPASAATAAASATPSAPSSTASASEAARTADAPTTPPISSPDRSTGDDAARPATGSAAAPAVAAPAATATAPLGAITAPTTVATPAGTPAADPGRVTGQIFPEVVRVAVSGADGGPQRLTIKLNPEALGEVRVVLTQRGGELEVSLAGGEDARRALSEGAPELRRLLETVGRADSRIVIRDLPGAGSTPTPTTSADGSAGRNDVSTDLGSEARSGSGRSGEPDADAGTARYRTTGSTTATDGTPIATSPSRVHTTSPSGRLGGLDVSI